MRPGSPRQGSGSVRGSERIHSGGRRGPDRRLADGLAAGRRAHLGAGDRGRRDGRPEQCQEPVEEGGALLLTAGAAIDSGAAVGDWNSTRLNSYRVANSLAVVNIS